MSDVSDRYSGLRDCVGIVTATDLAEMFGVSQRLLRDWRRMEEGPRFLLVGRNYFYRIKDIQSWLDAVADSGHALHLAEDTEFETGESVTGESADA